MWSNEMLPLQDRKYLVTQCPLGYSITETEHAGSNKVELLADKRAYVGLPLELTISPEIFPNGRAVYEV